MALLDELWLDAGAVCAVPPTAPTSSNRLAGKLHQLAVIARFLISSATILLAGRLSSEHWQGAEPGTGTELHLLYCGGGENRAYLHQLVFGATKAIPVQQPPRHWLLQLRRWRRLSVNADLLLLDLPFPLSHLFGRRTGIAVPAWLKQKVAIADSWEAVLARLRRKTRREVLRLISKHQLRARVVPAAAVAQRFYRTLYRPYIEQRYQQGAALVSERRFMRESRQGQVIELLQGERLLGAALLRRHGGELAVVWTGLTSTSDADALQGVTDALDFFSLLHAYQSGCRVLNLGGSRADLQDGLLRYKRKWGARVEIGRVPQTLLRVAPLRDTAAVCSFLGRHSFVAKENGELVGKLWHDTPVDAERLLELSEHLWNEGLARCELLIDIETITGAPAPPKLAISPMDGPAAWRAFWNVETGADRSPTTEKR